MIFPLSPRSSNISKDFPGHSLVYQDFLVCSLLYNTVKLGVHFSFVFHSSQEGNFDLTMWSLSARFLFSFLTQVFQNVENYFYSNKDPTNNFRRTLNIKSDFS